MNRKKHLSYFWRIGLPIVGLAVLMGCKPVEPADRPLIISDQGYNAFLHIQIGNTIAKQGSSSFDIVYEASDIPSSDSYPVTFFFSHISDEVKKELEKPGAIVLEFEEKPLNQKEYYRGVKPTPRLKLSKNLRETTEDTTSCVDSNCKGEGVVLTQLFQNLIQVPNNPDFPNTDLTLGTESRTIDFPKDFFKAGKQYTVVLAKKDPVTNTSKSLLTKPLLQNASNSVTEKRASLQDSPASIGTKAELLLDKYLLIVNAPIKEHPIYTRAFHDKLYSASISRSDCKETNADALGIPTNPAPNWYYTYENFIRAFEIYPDFMNAKAGDTVYYDGATPDDDTVPHTLTADEALQYNQVELAAFLAHMNQETGGHLPGDDDFWGIGCTIQEGYGVAWLPPDQRPTDVNLVPYYDQGYAVEHPEGLGTSGYFGRGPHQLSYNYNYGGFSEYNTGDAATYLKDPDIITYIPAIGIAGSLWFWNREEPSYVFHPTVPFKPAAHKVMQGTWNSTKADRLVQRDFAHRFGVTISIINGGVECAKGGTTPEEHAANRVSYFKAYLSELGATMIDGMDPDNQDCHLIKNFDSCPSHIGVPPNVENITQGCQSPMSTNSPKSPKKSKNKKQV